MTIERLDVSYCEGCDPVARVSVGPVSTRLAAERHRAGEQYAVLLAAGERPVGVIEVATGEAYVRAVLRPGACHRKRGRLLAPGRLFILEQRAGRTDLPPHDHGNKWLRRITRAPSRLSRYSRT